MSPLLCFFLTDTATTYIYTLSLHDALPICRHALLSLPGARQRAPQLHPRFGTEGRGPRADGQAVLPGHGRLDVPRSEEHTSELQSLTNLVCRLLLEKKKKKNTVTIELTLNQ